MPAGNAYVRVVLRVALVVAVLLSATPASAELRIRWDCYLPNANVDCSVLLASLTSKIPFLRVVGDVREADVAISLTSLPMEDGTRYELVLLGKKVDDDATVVRTADHIPSSIDPATAMVRLITKLERGLDDFMDQKIAAEVKNGKLDLELLDPSHLPFAGRPQQQALRWYVTPGVGSYFSDVQGVGINASANATISYNYSGRAWRAQQTLGVNYSQQSQPVAGADETASIRFVGGNAVNVLAFSLGGQHRWSAAILASAEKNPQANYTFRSNASVGVEYDLIPRQTVNQKNLGFRCAVGPEAQRYDATNVDGDDQQLVLRQFCDAYVSWHFVPVDVWASVGETTILENFDFRALTLSLSGTWRVTDNLQIAPWINVQGINRAINEARPVTTVNTDPKQEVEASMLAAIQQGYTAPLGVQTGLGVRYLFGNGSLASEDQRWKNVNNLR